MEKKHTRKTYRDSFSGYFSGMLQWKQFEDLWKILEADPADWYVYQPLTGVTPPATPLSKAEFHAFLTESETFLRDQQFADYCGAVYVNDVRSPGFVKIFHPRKMGAGCSVGGSSHEPVLPHWTLSKIRPERMREPAKASSRPAK